MTTLVKPTLVFGGIAAITALAVFGSSRSEAQDYRNPPAIIDLKSAFEVPVADARTEAIVAAADRFLATLDAGDRARVLLALDNDNQRANWSNLPEGAIPRAGLPRGEMTATQLAALDALLGTVMSEAGMRNTRLQLAAEDALGGRRFSSDFYYISFMGEPSTEAPWMLQFGGHHLALNVTVFGADLTFSPMLTGGQPLHIFYEGADVFITEKETRAAKALLDSLDAAQRAQALRSKTRAPLLLGPGEFGTMVAPEGLEGRDMTSEQRTLLTALIAARLEFINPDDFADEMARVTEGLDDTWFGWWGPTERLGDGYYRITGPNLVIEYAPQRLGGDYTDHAHSMYRDPTNDYGEAWIGTP